MIATLGNYEYVFAYIFDQAAGIDVEVRATGILSTSPIDNSNGFNYAWGTDLGPGVFAANHQHIFSLRVDPAIDGYVMRAMNLSTKRTDPTSQATRTQ